jgi:hypothetical protein
MFSIIVDSLLFSGYASNLFNLESYLGLCHARLSTTAVPPLLAGPAPFLDNDRLMM